MAVVFSVNMTTASIYETEPNVDNCIPGELSQAEKGKIIQLVNDIRGRHKIAPIPWNEEGEAFAQAAALSIAATGVPGHDPVPGKCASDNANEGRAGSNLHQGYRSAGTPNPTSEEQITGWLKDDHIFLDNGSPCTGHRRLIINPYLKSFAFGKVDAPHPTMSGMNINAAAFYGGLGGPNYGPSGCENDYISFPHENYPPAWVNKENFLSFTPLIDDTWYPFTTCDFSNAIITMADENGNNVATSNIAWDNDGHGIIRNAIYWRAANLRDSVKYIVKINNIIIGGTARNYEYWFKLTDEPTVPPAPLAEIPVLVLPANNATDIEAPVEFKWGQSENAVHYRIEAAFTNSFTYIVFEQDNITDTSFVLTELLNNATYYWRVAAYNVDNAISDYSEIWSFTTKEIIPDPPVAVFPLADMDNVARRDTYIWNSIEDADSYNLQISISENFATLAIDQKDIFDTTYHLSEEQMLEEFTNYFWRVKAVLHSSSETDWSAPIQYKTDDRLDGIVEELAGVIISCYPNPFNDFANIILESDKENKVKIEIYNLLGAKIADLYDGMIGSGVYNFDFKPSNDNAEIYFCKIQIGNSSKIIPLHFVKD